MTDVSDVKRGYWAGAWMNKDFIHVETYSGFRGGTDADYKGVQHFLPPDASVETLGKAVQDALSHSRFVLYAKREGFIYPPGVEFDKDFDLLEKKEARYKQWIADTMQRYGYKIKRALFKDMKNCSVEVYDNTMTIRHSHHEKNDAWSGDGINKEDYVVIPADSPPAEIGAALRLAFSRCT